MEENSREYHMQEIKQDNLVDGYAGTYFSKESRGIYHFEFDEETGELKGPELFCEAPNAKWVSLSGDLLVSSVNREEGAGTCFVQTEGTTIVQTEEILQERQPPCFICQEGEFVYTANYHEGTVMVYHLGKGKPSVAKRIENGVGAGCHQIVLHGAYMLVPCLVQQKIRLFNRDCGFALAGEIEFPAESGPRHCVFNKEHTRLYVVSEWSNELFIYKVQDIQFELMQILPLLPRKGERRQKRQAGRAAAAAVRLTKDERFLYVSVRGIDMIAAVDVSGSQAAIIQHAASGGTHPRDFILSRDERFMLVVNRFGGGIVSIERCPESGKITEIKSRIHLTEGVALVLSTQLKHLKEGLEGGI